MPPARPTEPVSTTSAPTGQPDTAPGSVEETKPPWEAALAVGLVSFCILAAELALTRVFSVLFRSPYVFLIVSGAIGGLGLGGLVAQGLRPSAARLRTWIAALSTLLALALAAPVLILFALPFGRDLVARAETAVVLALPMVTFTVAGVLLSLLFRRYAASIGRLYFIDLACAAAAAPCSVLLLNGIGGLNTPLLLGVASAAAGVAVAWRARARAWLAAAAVTGVALLAVLGTNLATGWITLPPLQTPYEARRDPGHPWYLTTKPLFTELGDPYSGSHIVRTDWTAISRTDVVGDGDGEVFYVYTDGDVPTQMAAWDGTMDSVRRDYAHFIGMLPYRLLGRAPNRVMAIGSGGGLDVLLAKANGAREVDAVEINPAIPSVVADPRFRSTYARIYREPGVRLIVDEGRSYLQRAGAFDLIYFACAKTATTQTSGVALLDNHLYTIEAFGDYWRHLTADGMLALVTQEGFLIDRLLVTAIAALRGMGIPGAENHVMLVRLPEAMFGTGPYRHALLLRRTPWTPDAMRGVQQAVVANGLEALYLPHVRPQGAGGGTIPPSGTIAEIQAALERQYPTGDGAGKDNYPSLSAVTDDSPFYVDVARGLHPFLKDLLIGTGIASAAVLLFVFVLGLRQPGPRSSGAALRVGSATLFFAMLGAGFILVELALLQQFILLLGMPTRSLTVTLFALLIASALGSRSTERGTPEEAVARLKRALPALVLLLVAYRFALAPLVSVLLALPLPVRAGATMLLLVPPGFLMGLPFATALRAMGEPLTRLAPAFWSVNGVTTILGSVLTMSLAKWIGYSGALLSGAACYVAAWLLVGGFLCSTPSAASTRDAPVEASLVSGTEG